MTIGLDNDRMGYPLYSLKILEAKQFSLLASKQSK